VVQATSPELEEGRMFVQVIQAQPKDRNDAKDMWDRWDAEVKPAAKANGFLGATGGITGDGSLIVIARFESENAAEKNNNLSEQQQWYSEFEKRIEGEPSFTNYTNVELQDGGGSNDAGFVQVIRITGGDVEAFRKADEAAGPKMKELRPDVIGSVNAWTDDGDVTTVIYFTSEADARKNESSPEFQEAAKEFMSLPGESTFFDLADPWLS
jgi:quinol monooxygenase YgiN